MAVGPGARRPGETDPDVAPEANRPRLLRSLLGTDTLTLDDAPGARLKGWLWPLAVTLLAGLLRFWDLGRPHKLVFDETYYVKDAWSLLVNGYEANWADDSNPAFEAGDTSGLLTSGEYVVHPQVGKWLIALGIQLGGASRARARGGSPRPSAAPSPC